MLELTGAKDDPAVFRQQLRVDCNGTPRLLDSVLQPWQRRDFEALDDGWRRIVGVPFAGLPISRAYLERPRGHSKTTDNACMASWALYASSGKLSGVAAAASKDQAKLLRDGVDTLVRLNPWLGKELSVQNYRVVNKTTGSELTILASEDTTNYGLTPDFIIIDELTHWKKRDLWDSLISSAAKREYCMVNVISNAGRGKGTSWQWLTREACRTSERWHFSRIDGPQAEWITPESLEEQRRLLPVTAYNRLWLNLWQSESNDSIDSEDIEACCVAEGPLSRPEKYAAYVAGLDLGLKHDHAAFTVLGLDPLTHRSRLVYCKNWDPHDNGGKVSLLAVEREVLRVCRLFNIAVLAYDPWQCERSGEELRRQGIRAIGIEFVPKTLDLIATRLLNALRHHEIELYRDEGLLRDLGRLEIVERPQGFRLQAVRDEHGHCDRATALALAIAISHDVMRELIEGWSPTLDLVKA